MTQEHQAEFVTNFLNSIRDELVDKIEKGDVPERWDGHELRSWIHEKTAFEVTLRDGRSARARDFKNTLLVNNL